MSKLGRDMTDWIASVGWKYGYDWDNLPTDKQIADVNELEDKIKKLVDKYTK